MVRYFTREKCRVSKFKVYDITDVLGAPCMFTILRQKSAFSRNLCKFPVSNQSLSSFLAVKFLISALKGADQFRLLFFKIRLNSERFDDLDLFILFYLIDSFLRTKSVYFYAVSRHFLIIITFRTYRRIILFPTSSPQDNRRLMKLNRKYTKKYSQINQEINELGAQIRCLLSYSDCLTCSKLTNTITFCYLELNPLCLLYCS